MQFIFTTEIVGCFEDANYFGFRFLPALFLAVAKTERSILYCVRAMKEYPISATT